MKAILACLILCVVFWSGIAVGGTGESGPTKIAMTRVSPSDFAVYTADYTPNPDPNNCGNPNYFMWDFVQWDSGKKALWSAILGAHLAGKTVNIISGSCIYGGTINKIDAVYIKD